MVSVKGIIFDLDMCILDTRTLEGPFFDPVLHALDAWETSGELKQKARNQLLTTSLDDVVTLLAVPEFIAERMRDAYRLITVPLGIKSFGDEEYIRSLPLTKILVTSGYAKFQEAKIVQLEIRDLFDRIIIDALDDQSARKGKKRIFQELLEAYGWKNNEVLVVGDNPASELGAAKALHIKTIQILRPSVQRWDEADHYIHSFSELAALI